MKFRLPLLALTALAIASCTTISVPPANEKLSLNPNSYGYTSPQRHAGSRHGSSVEYINPNEPLASSKSFVTLLYYKTDDSAKTFTEWIIAGYKEKYPSAILAPKQISESEYFLEVKDKNACGGPSGPHRSVRKFIKGSEGVFMAAYSQNEERVSNHGEYNAWSARIMKTKLLK